MTTSFRHVQSTIVTALTITMFASNACTLVRAFSPLTYATGINSLRATTPAFCSHRHRHRHQCSRTPVLCAILRDPYRSTSKLFSTKQQTDVETDTDTSSPVPMTLLAGFLGSGKTTTLQNLLTNNDGIKIGIVVNDVASVNIDSKLLSNPNNVVGGEGTVELQNGCACCSLADELLTSVQQLTNNGQRDLDAIVIELSGVADPVAVKDNWKNAEMMNHPATKYATMDKVVTLVDSSTFGTDWMTWDTSGDRDGWLGPNSDHSLERNVPELLSEQIEAANVLILNKIDLADNGQRQIASTMVKALNEKAELHEVQFGGIKISDVIGTSLGDQHDSAEPDCTDETHSHSHEHAEHEDSSHSEPVSTDSSHDHSSHSHDHEEPCADVTCTDPTHDHSHSHKHEEPCADAECTDPTHDHSHSHNHHGTSTDTHGITNFVYKSDRPFNPQRLLGILNTWPVPVKDDLDIGLVAEAAEEGYNVKGVPQSSPFVGVLRSKGFCWMAPVQWVGAGDDVWRHNTAMFWSHAGKHFGISTAGKWWGTIPKEQMKGFFVGNQQEYERILKEDFITEEFGDRRQEIVFIGANIDEGEIRKALDKCLCNDEEMSHYRQELAKFQQSSNTPSKKKYYKPVSDEGS